MTELIDNQIWQNTAAQAVNEAAGLRLRWHEVLKLPRRMESLDRAREIAAQALKTSGIPQVETVTPGSPHGALARAQQLLALHANRARALQTELEHATARQKAAEDRIVLLEAVAVAVGDYCGQCRDGDRVDIWLNAYMHVTDALAAYRAHDAGRDGVLPPRGGAHA